jgi:hypothetical protein
MNAQTNAQNEAHDDTMDMLDETLDDLADMPSTKPFPAGAHLVSLKMKRIPKKVGGYVVEMTFKNVVELSNPSSEEPAVGDKSTMFIHTKKKDQTPNEFGQGQLKLFLKPIGAMLGTNSIQECLDATNAGLDIIAVVSVRKGTEQYPDDQQGIVKVELAE